MCGSKLFGGGSSYTAPKVEQVAPTPQAVTTSDVTDDASGISQEVEKQRKKRGYASTRTSTDRDTIAGMAQAQGKKTLG